VAPGNFENNYQHGRKHWRIGKIVKVYPNRSGQVISSDEYVEETLTEDQQ
jgi:hypothetical protein